MFEKLLYIKKELKEKNEKKFYHDIPMKNSRS